MVQGKPGRGNKRQQIARAAREAKRQRRDLELERLNREAELIELDLPGDLLARVGVEEDSEQSEDDAGSDSESEDEEDCEITDNEEEPVEVDTSALETLMASSRQIGYDAFEDNTTTFHYQRSAEPSIRTLQRQVKNSRELQEAAKDTRTLESYFQRPGGKQANPVTLGRPTPSISTAERQRNERDAAIKSIKKKIESKKMGMNGQNLMRHQAVLAFLQIQKSKQLGETREHLALQVARCYGKGIYFARRIVAWEREWIEDGVIPEGKRGCYTKTKSWFRDEGVEQAVREWLSGRSGKEITAYSLAKVVGDYLDSERATKVVENILKFGPGGNRIRVRTARRWLKRLGLVHGRYTKGVYVDGHEREDVVFYRQQVFLPRWSELKRRLVIFDEDGNWKLPPGLKEGEKPLVFVTHDESTFNANDGKRLGWMLKGHQPLM